MDRLAQLAARHALGEAAVARLERLLGCLERPEAPTTVHARAQAVDVHVADSLVALELDEVRGAGLIADLGAGAGLPGLALAAALPDAEVVLVESARRKCEFIAAAAAEMGLANARVEWARAEEWREGAGRCDAVCARALAALPILCEYAAPLLAPGGSAVLWKGEVSPQEEADARAAAGVLGLSEPVARAVAPFAGSERRSLWTLRKVAPTPDRFPRRAGMAVKRPLSAGRS